jgi:MFS transporter, DHA1 family, multidrug resistance protein
MKRGQSCNKFTIILILGLLTAIGPLSIDMYLPAFPSIAKSLHSTISEVTLSLSGFFLGISIGQLLYGPLLERFGRKKPLYVGLCFYFLASIGCAIAGSVQVLIILRLFQALGGCVGLVAGRAMVRDLFDVEEIAKIFSLLMLVVSVSPIIAPTLGGYITSALGWRYVFVVLIFVVLVILLGTYLFLPESKKPDASFSLKPIPIVKNFIVIIKCPQFLTYTLTGSISYAGLYAYISGAPFVFMELFKVSYTQFGWIFALIAMGLIGASQANNLALKYYNSEQIVRIASFIQCITGVTLFSITLLGWNSQFLTICLIFIFLSCQGFIFPNSTALALSPIKYNIGSASALIGSIQMTMGAIASATVSMLENHTALPMSGIMTCCAVGAFCTLTLSKKFTTNGVTQQAIEMREIETIGSL